MSRDQASDLHGLRDDLVSEGGLELPRVRAHWGTSRSIDTRADQAIQPAGQRLTSSGRIRVHPRQYHAKYHAAAGTLVTNAAEVLRVLALFVAPVGLATFDVVAILAAASYVVVAWLTIAVVFLLGVAVARTAGRPVPSSPIVRRINRRAAIVLPVAAVLLAGLLELVATHGLVPLVALAYVATYAGVMMFAGWASWHLAPTSDHLVARVRAQLRGRWSAR